MKNYSILNQLDSKEAEWDCLRKILELTQLLIESDEDLKQRIEKLEELKNV